MEKSLIHFIVMFPSCNKTSIITDPSDSALNFPAPFITPKWTTILGFWLAPVSSVRTHKLNTLFTKFFSELIRIITFIANQTMGLFTNFFKCLLGQFYLRRTGRVNGHSQRNTLAVSQYHELRALAALGFADFEAPFLAATKLPSMKHSPHWIWPLLSKLSINLRQIFSHVPFSSHNFSRLQQVLGLGYFSGKSFHLAPVRRIQRMPSSTSRFFFQGRPPLFNFGSNGSMYFHCFSVKYITRLIGLFSLLEPFIGNQL